ncbi:MAG: hypothetical protein IJZ88_05840 [Clostridia bacterium]|nr:hypothetical protein [Clostridia bacterium]
MSSKKEIKTILMLIILILCSVLLGSGCLFMLLVMMFEGPWWLIGVALFAVPLFFTIKKIIKIRKTPHPAKTKQEEITKTVKKHTTYNCTEPDYKQTLPIELKGKRIAFFSRDGVLQSVYPRTGEYNRNSASEVDYFIIEGNIFDLNNPYDVKSIDIQQFNPVRDISYDLSFVIKNRVDLIDDNKMRVTTAFKAIELMKKSKSQWYSRDYLSLSNSLMKIGEFETADKIYLEAQKVEDRLKENEYKYFKDLISDHDLVFTPSHNSTCGICSKYQNRVYSVSGRDKRFPKLPVEVIKTGKFHSGCRHRFFAFFYFEGCTIEDTVFDEDTGLYKTISFDAIKYSNRPFIDTRDDYEKRLHQRYLSSPHSLLDSYELQKSRYKSQWQSSQEYKLVEAVLPNIAPKTLTGYRRMKTGNTKNYQKIVEAMRNNGYPHFAENENITKEI